MSCQGTGPFKRQIRLHVDLGFDLECRELVQSLTLTVSGPLLGPWEVKRSERGGRSLVPSQISFSSCPDSLGRRNTRYN